MGKNASSDNKRVTEIIGILRKHRIVSGISAEELPLLLEDLGPTFVKMGQIMSMQPNILPVEYCNELAKLRANVTSMSIEEVQGILEDEYGTELHKIFAEFEAVPLGAASMAQVHRAELVDGTEVVVKIQRLGIYDTMSKDIVLLKKAARLLKYTPKIGGIIDFEMVIDEMWAAAKEEMDFTVEATNTKEFYDNNVEVVFVTCPKIMTDYSTIRVLVMEYVKGYPINQVETLMENGYNMEEIGMKLAYNFVKQVIEDGFFHGDPHTGNIIIRGGQIVWIDLGMMGRLSSRDRKIFFEAIMAVVENDTIKLKDLVLSLGKCKGKIDHLQLSSDLDNLLSKYAAMDFHNMDLTELSDDFLTILKEHRIAMPKGISMLGRSMITIQGTLRELSPQINFIEILTSFVSNDFVKFFDVKKELGKVVKSTYFSFQKSLEIPSQISDLLKMLNKGISKINLEVNMTDEMNTKLEKMINKLVITIMSAALLLGSSLISTTNMQPKILGIPAIGFAGFVISFVLGSWLVIKIVRKK